MRPMLFALTLMALSVVWWPTAPAVAQDSRVARGTVADIGARWIIVTVGDHDVKFDVDNRTTVGARGAPTRAHEALLSGKPGPHLDGLLKVGQAVAVTYDGTAGAWRATRILSISAASAASGPTGMTSAGVVTAVGVDTLTISGHGTGGGTTSQTFTIDPGTRLFAKGASTAAAATGGRAPFTEFVASGDQVRITYRKTGSSLVASEIRVTTKKGTR